MEGPKVPTGLMGSHEPPLEGDRGCFAGAAARWGLGETLDLVRVCVIGSLSGHARSVFVSLLVLHLQFGKLLPPELCFLAEDVLQTIASLRQGAIQCGSWCTALSL